MKLAIVVITVSSEGVIVVEYQNWNPLEHLEFAQTILHENTYKQFSLQLLFYVSAETATSAAPSVNIKLR